MIYWQKLYPPPLLSLNIWVQTLGFLPWTSPKLRNWTLLRSPFLPNSRARNRAFLYCAPPPAECPETSLLALASRELLSDQSPSIGTKAQSLWTQVWIWKRLTLTVSGAPCQINWTLSMIHFCLFKGPIQMHQITYSNFWQPNHMNMPFYVLNMPLWLNITSNLSVVSLYTT